MTQRVNVFIYCFEKYLSFSGVSTISPERVWEVLIFAIISEKLHESKAFLWVRTLDLPLQDFVKLGFFSTLLRIKIWNVFLKVDKKTTF